PPHFGELLGRAIAGAGIFDPAPIAFDPQPRAILGNAKAQTRKPIRQLNALEGCELQQVDHVGVWIVGGNALKARVVDALMPAQRLVSLSGNALEAHDLLVAGAMPHLINALLNLDELARIAKRCALLVAQRLRRR